LKIDGPDAAAKKCLSDIWRPDVCAMCALQAKMVEIGWGPAL